MEMEPDCWRSKKGEKNKLWNALQMGKPTSVEKHVIQLGVL